MSKLSDYSKFDLIFWESGQEPTIPSSENKTDGTWLYTDIHIGQMAINVADDKIWMRTENGIVEIITDETTELTLDLIQFNLGYTGSTPEGSLSWDDDHKTLNIGLDSGSNLSVGQESLIRVVNKLGFDVNNGTLVYINGAQGNRPTIDVADYSDEEEADYVIGMVTTEPSIGDNDTGYVCIRGLVHNVDTLGYTEGTKLFLGASGSYTDTEPVSPLHRTRIGYVITESATEGVILVSIKTGTDIDELHNVIISGTPSNRSVLQYDTSDNLWKNKDSLTASYLAADDLSNTSQKVITTGPTAGGRLYAEINTDNQFITDSTLISAISNESNWTNGIYGSTSIGAVEGQMYINSNYLYIYDNSQFTRYRNEWSDKTSDIGYAGGTISGTLSITGPVYMGTYPTDYIQVGTQGHLIKRGAATTWRDEFSDITSLKILGVGVSINTTEGLLEYLDSADLNDWGLRNLQVNHDFIGTGSIHPHIHWQQKTNTYPNMLLGWRWQINGAAWTTGWSYSVFNEHIFPWIGATMNQISEVEIPIPANYGISDICQLRLHRDTGNASGLFSGGDTYSGVWGVSSFDAHIECDTEGSNNEYTK